MLRRRSTHATQKVFKVFSVRMWVSNLRAVALNHEPSILAMDGDFELDAKHLNSQLL